MSIKNEEVKNYPFLEEMFEDPYFPNFLVEKGVKIFMNLCETIESKKPKTLEELYVLTQSATEEFNVLQDEFFEHDSEIETAARECIGEGFWFIGMAYGFKDEDIDRDELIATRDW